jgi:transcriptional regulator with XRE-family HTH domain
MTTRRRKPERAELYGSEPFLTLTTTLAANLRRLREERGITQEEASARCELPLRTYQLCETGRANAALVTLGRLAAGFEVQAAELLTRKP